MKKQRETLTGNEHNFAKGCFSIASPQCGMNLFSPFHPTILFVGNGFVCGRFLSVASLEGLIHEGTMTSLCMAMTEEQHKSVIIDCSGSQPQFYNAGKQ
jgi:hypothetical protein